MKVNKHFVKKTAVDRQKKCVVLEVCGHKQNEGIKEVAVKGKSLNTCVEFFSTLPSGSVQVSKRTLFVKRKIDFFFFV